MFCVFNYVHIPTLFLQGVIPHIHRSLMGKSPQAGAAKAKMEKLLPEMMWVHPESYSRDSSWFQDPNVKNYHSDNFMLSIFACSSYVLNMFMQLFIRMSVLARCQQFQASKFDSKNDTEADRSQTFKPCAVCKITLKQTWTIRAHY